MKVPHYSRLGSPTSPSGAFSLINSQEGIILFYADIFKTTLQANGIQITPEIEEHILSYCRERQAETDRQLDSEGIPEKLLTLLEFTKKSKAVAYCKRIQLSEHDLALLAHNCSQIGFKHQSKFTEFVPQGLKVLDSDISDMKRGAPRQFFNKVSRTIEERKRNHVHLFERGKEWHCFYFSYRDMEDGRKSHWKLGSHIHYVSYLWSDLRKRQIWESFDQRNIDFQGAHIRLEYDDIQGTHFRLELPVIDPRHIND